MPRHMRSPRPSERRHRVLFLAADPRDTTRLAHDEECAAIEHELRLTLGRDEFEFRSKWAVSVDEMMRHLNECLPTIVHFSGHGSTAIITTSFIPLEIYELIEHESWMKIGVILLNALIVVYLVRRLRREGHWPFHRRRALGELH